VDDVAIEPGVHQLAVGDGAAGSRYPIRLNVEVGVDDLAPVAVPPGQVDLLVELVSSDQLLKSVEDFL
jgi:hypothetical protein